MNEKKSATENGVPSAEVFDYYNSLIQNWSLSKKELRNTLKAELTNNGVLKYGRYLRRENFKNGFIDGNPWKLKIDDLYSTTPEVAKQIDLINNAKWQKQKRCLNRVSKMVLHGMENNIPCYFVTLTFTNETLERLDSLTRRRYVSRYARSLDAVDYYCNIDYGEKNGREHYHGVILGGNQKWSEWEKYGFFKIETIGNDHTDEIRIGKYITKLSNHAIKESTGSDTCITKRGAKY